MEIKIESDIEQLIKKFNRVTGGIDKGIIAGLSSVATHIGEEAIPITPIDTGNLRQSFTTVVKGRRTAYLLNTAEYALYVHEADEKVKFKVGGNKFLKKTIMNRVQYFTERFSKILVKHMKDVK